MSRKNQGDSKPRYGAQELRRIVAEGEKALGRGDELDDPWLYVAAAHALDLFDVQGLARVRLDFTGMTQDGILDVVVVSAMMLQKEGRPEGEVRQVLAKRLAAYTMFQVYNDLSEMGLDVRFDCGPTSYSLVATLPDGASISFNFLGRATFALRRFEFKSLSGSLAHARGLSASQRIASTSLAATPSETLGSIVGPLPSVVRPRLAARPFHGPEGAETIFRIRPRLNTASGTEGPVCGLPRTRALGCCFLN